MKVFLSDRIDKERIPFAASDDIIYGKAHYSWKIITRLYDQGLQAIGVQTARITAPDIYQSPDARRCAKIGNDDLHIVVKPIEHIRPMFGTRNFFICGWEFPEFSEQPFDEKIGNNHIAILKRAERIFCWSSFSAKNLARYGVNSAIALPPPVVALLDQTSEPIDHLSCLQYDGSPETGLKYRSVGDIQKDYQNTFFTVLNPWDRRKNFANMVSAFTKHAVTHEKNKSALIIKLVIDNVNTRTENIIDILKIHFDTHEKCPDIYFIGEQLNPAHMMGFYKNLDFYIAATSAEGLNLPLIEAMAAGMVPISSTATAMGDYVTKRNSIVLPTEAVPAGPYISALGEGFPLTIFTPKLDGLIKAFAEAAAMQRDDRATKAANARKTVETRYGLKRFETDFRKVVQGK